MLPVKCKMGNKSQKCDKTNIKYNQISLSVEILFLSRQVTCKTNPFLFIEGALGKTKKNKDMFHEKCKLKQKPETATIKCEKFLCLLKH